MDAFEKQPQMFPQTFDESYTHARVESIKISSLTGVQEEHVMKTRSTVSYARVVKRV